jgi:hypothetical protein
MSKDPIRIYPVATDTAGCFYQRLKMPLDALARMFSDEFEVCWNCEPKDGIVLGQRLTGSGDQPNAQWQIWAERDDLALVYEIDDDILNIDPGNAVPYAVFAPHREGTAKTIAMSDAVIASTVGLMESLARDLGASAPPIHIAYNCVENVSDIDFGAIHLGHPEAVIWAGSQFHGQDFPGVTIDELESVARAHPRVGWVSIGANYLPWAKSIGWSDIPGYHRNLAMFAGTGIGIAPLLSSRFNESKSWIKALDYAAHGIVPIVPPIGGYWHAAADLVDPFALTFGLGLEGAPSTYGEALDTYLSGDREVRLSNAIRVHEAAKAWTIDKQVWRWVGVFRDAIAAKGL